MLLQVLLPASSLLQLNGVREACCYFLLKQLHPSNCLGIRSFAGKTSFVDSSPIVKISRDKVCLQHANANCIFVSRRTYL